MNSEYRAYKRLYRFLTAILSVFYKIEVVGLNNIPDGPALLCANHSSNFDPIMISMAAGLRHHIHYMAKIELFRVPILSPVLKAIGCFPVDRGKNTSQAIKVSIRYLRAGEKLGIFPEGTRSKTAGEKTAKKGAVRLADQMNAPIVPVYLPRKKRPFSKVRIEFKEPYFVNPERLKLSQEDFGKLSVELMERINKVETSAKEAAS